MFKIANGIKKAQRIRYCIYLMLLLNVACAMNGADRVENMKAGYEASGESYTYPFHEYGFSVTAPCKMEDVSRHSSGDLIIWKRNSTGFQMDSK